jgi:hypothetical protein
MADIKNPIGLGAMLSGGSALAQALIQGISALNANKKFKQTLADRPTLGAEYLKPYESILAKYNQVYGGNKPGFEQQLDQISQLGARARGSAERGAISSNSYLTQVGDIHQRGLDAIQKEYLSNAEFKLSGVDKTAGATAMLGEKQTEQWNINKYIPWQTEMNRWGEKQKASTEGFWGALQGGIGGITDLLGTKYAADALKSQSKTPVQIAAEKAGMSVSEYLAKAAQQPSI